MSANQNSKKDSKNVKTLFSIVCLCIIALGLIVYFSTNSKAQKGTVNENTTIVDTTDIEKVKAAIRPNTKLIHIETPGNPTLSISDIEKIAELAHANGALLSVDNTFASPFNQRPIELGADFTVESLTKYINGHGDAMGGAIIGKQEYLDIIRAQSQINLGATISPFNAWLIMRGSVTLPLRMKQHNENAIKVARYLKMVKGVSFCELYARARRLDRTKYYYRV